MKTVNITKDGNCPDCGTSTQAGHQHYCASAGKNVRAVIANAGISTMETAFASGNASRALAGTAASSAWS